MNGSSSSVLLDGAWLGVDMGTGGDAWPAIPEYSDVTGLCLGQCLAL